MSETLILTTPITQSTISYTVKDLYLNRYEPSIKITLISNLGREEPIRIIPSDTITADQIVNKINYIGTGKFKTIDGLNLNDWLIDQILLFGFKVGTRT